MIAELLVAPAWASPDSASATAVCAFRTRSRAALNAASLEFSGRPSQSKPTSAAPLNDAVPMSTPE